MVDIDLSSFSKSELQKLMRRSKQRLHGIKNKAEKPELKSSDPRVNAIADEVRALSEELGIKRRDVFMAIAGNMRVAVASESDKAPRQTGGNAVSSHSQTTDESRERKRAPAASSGAKARSASSEVDKSAKQTAAEKSKTKKAVTKSKTVGQKNQRKVKRSGKKQVE